MAKQTKPAPGALTVFDSEKNDFVEVSHDMQRTAGYVHQQVQLGAFMSAMGIKKMFDEKLYLALNCSSREEYIETMTSYGRRQAYKLYAIANKLDGVVRGLNGGESPLQITEGGIKVQSTALNEVAGLGVEKLYDLIREDEDELKELIKTGKMKIDGNEITIEEIKEMSAREVSKLVSENKKKFTNKITQLDEALKLAKSDIKDKEKLIDNLTKQNAHAEQIEKTLGPVASRIKDKAERLAEAKDLLNEFTQVLVRSGVTNEDPEELQKDLKVLVKSIDEIHKRMMGNFEEVLENEF